MSRVGEGNKKVYISTRLKHYVCSVTSAGNITGAEDKKVRIQRGD